MKLTELMAAVNVSRSRLLQVLKLLEVDGLVIRTGPQYFRTPNPWKPDETRAHQVTAQRYAELAQMQAYMRHTGCLMEFLTHALDDPQAHVCGKCAVCTGKGWPADVPVARVGQAVAFLKRDELAIDPRKMSADYHRLPAELLNQPGRALCAYGDSGWGKLVRSGKYEVGCFGDELVAAAVELIRDRWRPDPTPAWVTAIPSRRHPRLVYDFAERLAHALGIPFVPVLDRIADAPEQKSMANSCQQAANVRRSLSMAGQPLTGPVLLVDDIVDSRWTMTVAGQLLREQGSGPVYPLALARATSRYD